MGGKKEFCVPPSFLRWENIWNTEAYILFCLCSRSSNAIYLKYFNRSQSSRWLARNRSHFPDLNYNERHQVKIIWRHLKKRKGKKKKKEKNTHFGKSKLFFFFLLPLTCWQLKSPHMLIGLPRTVVCGGDNWFMCSFAYPLMPAAEYSTASRSASRHSPGKSGGLSETAVR